jgi:hypothetical protein
MVVEPNPGFALQLHEFGRSGCCLETWKAWDEARLDHCFAQVIMCPCSSCVCVCGGGGASKVVLFQCSGQDRKYMRKSLVAHASGCVLADLLHSVVASCS